MRCRVKHDQAITFGTFQEGAIFGLENWIYRDEDCLNGAEAL